MQQETIREAVGVFKDIQHLNEAVAELETTAFPRHDISVMGDLTKTGGLPPDIVEDNPEAARNVLIRPEEKNIGGAFLVGGGLYAGAVTGMLTAGSLADFQMFLAMALGGAAFGAMLGGFIAWLLGSYYDGVLTKQMKNGGMVVWVRTPNRHLEKIAQNILKRHGGRHVHVHQI